MHPDEEIAALAEHPRRAAGTDAERRAARHLEERLRSLGREAELQPIRVGPRAALTQALHAALAVAGSLLSVARPALGAALVLLAALLTALDVTGVLRLTRRVTGWRASQNVVSREHGGKDGALVLVAPYDVPRRSDLLERVTKQLRDPWAVLLTAMLLLLACCALRVTGFEGAGLAAAQLVPTAILVAAVAVLVDSTLAPPRATAEDGGAGVVTALRLADELGGTLEQFDLWIVFTGAHEAFASGMGEWLRSTRGQPVRERAVVIGLDGAGAGELRYAERHGALIPLKADPRLMRLCHSIVADGIDASDVVLREPVDAAAATARGMPALTIAGTGGQAGRDSLEHAFAFCTELARRIDAELGASGGRG